MKYVKMLGLAAVAAAALMAFIGAGTASATTLCKATDTPDCSLANTYAAGTTIHASLKPGTSARLFSGSTTISTCTESTVHGKTTNTTATVIDGNIEKLTFGKCTEPATAVALGSLDIHWISGTHNGKVTGTANQVTVLAFGGISCTYGTGAGTTLGTLTGGTQAVMHINATVSKTAGGFLCPSTAGWQGEYIVTTPHTLYVTT
jgi:hypothetical protein